MNAIQRIAKAHGVPVAVIMSNPQNGKGYDAQCEFIDTLISRDMDVATIAKFFGQEKSWVHRRIDRHAKLKAGRVTA